METGELVIIIVATLFGLVVKDVSVLLLVVKLYGGMLDKSNAKHYYQEHVLDKGTGETVKNHLIRCDAACPARRRR
jgi:hypothetical protein